MSIFYRGKTLALGIMLLPSIEAYAELPVQVNGNLSLELRAFEDSAIRDEQSNSNASVLLAPEFYYELGDGRDSVRVTPLLRWDAADEERTHGDIRELRWVQVNDTWEASVGVNTIFWGVTETAHLVNVINQLDSVESQDGEALLGQPMINLTLVRDWGNLDLFIMPGFRERTFPGREGRPGSSHVLVSNDQAIYESAAEEKHTDLALRWSQQVDVWDIGVSYFRGTSREPRFSDQLTYGETPFALNSDDEMELRPIYDQIDQVGVDVQATIDAWLLKFEAIHRRGQDEPFTAAAAGFEYTFFDVMYSGIDVGLISEYLFDERDSSGTDNDLSLAFRLSFNDINSTEFLAAVGEDLDNNSRFFYVEGSRRVGNAFKVSLEVRGVSQVAEGDPLQALEGDNFAQLEIGYYF